MPVIKIININGLVVAMTALNGSARQVAPKWKLLPGGDSVLIGVLLEWIASLARARL